MVIDSVTNHSKARSVKMVPYWCQLSPSASSAATAKIAMTGRYEVSLCSSLGGSRSK